MDWDDVQREGKAKGYLVYAMDQAQTPLATSGLAARLTDEFAHGYCLGLCATWCAHMYRGEDFPAAGGVCERPPLKAGLVHWLTGRVGLKDWTSEWTQAAALEYMGTSDGLRAKRNHKPTAAFLYSVVTKAYGCYGVSMSRPGGSHAVALRHAPDNRMHVFDPNYGHFAVADHTKLKDLLRWLLAESGYADKYVSSVAVIGITPAINWKDVYAQF